ncbi:hypothetical protein HPB49_004233 [Dermacentor silvarum]|uniref:Uncharacterized protein n=1 Tax=Dermacentor silvarum TaxID=543639 RepID=A0ACB8CPY5_DERSI|nr:hypothetical protein HPB49_004233 [Dermacentor silvarum]
MPLASAASDQHADTILFRPVGKRACFLALSKEAIAAQLSCIDGAHRVRVNFRRNVVAVDALPGADLSALLDVRAIADVPVRAKALAKNTCSGTIFGVDTAFDADTIRENIEAPVAVLSCARSGRNVTVRFAGNMVPGDVLLFKQRRLLRPRLPRPLQCGRCGAFGHAEATCSRDARCLRCGGSHDTSSCTAQRPRCINCTGGHATLEPRCPNWQLERRAAILLAASEERISRHKALELAKARASSLAMQQRGGTAPRLSATVQPGLSFRDALTGSSAPPAEQTQPQQPATSYPRDALIAALAAALRVLLETTPMDDDFSNNGRVDDTSGMVVTCSCGKDAAWYCGDIGENGIPNGGWGYRGAVTKPGVVTKGCGSCGGEKTCVGTAAASQTSGGVG